MGGAAGEEEVLQLPGNPCRSEEPRPVLLALDELPGLFIDLQIEAGDVRSGLE
jgi:hypothetical protein